MKRVVLGVDPGTRKIGFAALDDAGVVIAQGIQPLVGLVDCLSAIASEHKVVAVALGMGTHSRQVQAELACLGVPIHLIDERETSLQARARYFADHPPRGWRRLIPLGMQTPPCPIDDYAAILIAERYLREGPAEPAS